MPKILSAPGRRHFPGATRRSLSRTFQDRETSRLNESPWHCRASELPGGAAASKTGFGRAGPVTYLCDPIPTGSG